MLKCGNLRLIVAGWNTMKCNVQRSNGGKMQYVVAVNCKVTTY